MTITKNKPIFRFGALLLTFAMLLALTPLGAMTARAAGETAPQLSEGAWTWTTPGVVATMEVASDATLAEDKAMEKSSQWSTDGATWSADDLTTAIVAAQRGDKLYIYTPLSGMGVTSNAILPNIKAAVAVDIDPSITAGGHYFMAYYAKNCTSLTKLGVPDTSKLETVGNNFMNAYAYACSSLTELDVPDTSGITAAGNLFMGSYARECSLLTTLDVPDTSKLETADDNF